MLTTDDDAVAARARVMALHGITRDAWKRYTAAGSWFYEVSDAGYKYNLTDIAAALGRVQLRPAARDAGRAAPASPRATMRASPGSTRSRRSVTRPGVGHAWHLYSIRLRLDRLSIDRARFIQEIKERQIGTSVHFIPLHRQPFYAATYGYSAAQFPVAEAVYPRLVSLPIYSPHDGRGRRLRRRGRGRRRRSVPRLTARRIVLVGPAPPPMGGMTRYALRTCSSRSSPGATGSPCWPTTCRRRSVRKVTTEAFGLEFRRPRRRRRQRAGAGVRRAGSSWSSTGSAGASGWTSCTCSRRPATASSGTRPTSRSPGGTGPDDLPPARSVRRPVPGLGLGGAGADAALARLADVAHRAVPGLADVLRGMTRRPVRAIFNGVRTAELAPPDGWAHSDGSTVRVVALGTLGERKGTFDLLAAGRAAAGAAARPPLHLCGGRARSSGSARSPTSGG